MAACPSGYQPSRKSQSDDEGREAVGCDQEFIGDYRGSNLDNYNHPNTAIEPPIPGIFQYYSIAEDELARGMTGGYASV